MNLTQYKNVRGVLSDRPVQLAMAVLVFVLVLALASVPVLAVLGGYAYYQMSGKIAPGVRVGESRLEWLTVEDAAIQLHRDWNLNQSLVVSDGLHTWQVPVDQFGITLDSIQTARRAFGIGRRQPMMAEIRQAASSWLYGWQVEPVAAVDLEQARIALEFLNTQATLPPRDASLHWDGEKLTSIPGELGYAINIEESLEIINRNPSLVLTSGYLRMPLKPLIPAVNDVAVAMQEAQRLVDTRLTIQAYDPISNEQFQWEVPREVIGSWLAFHPGASGPEVAIETESLATYLDSLNIELGEGRYLKAEQYAQPLLDALARGQPLQMTVNHTPTEYTVQPGETLISISWKVGVPFWMIANANPEIDPNSLRTGQTITIPSKDDLLPLPVVPNKRIVISIGQQRLWVYQDGQQVAEHIISTGIDRSPTQPGVFQVQTHEPEAYASVWDLTMPNFLGIYEAWPGFMNGIHGLPMLSNGKRLWAKILGKPASYGCIILDLDAAESLYNWAENGVVVEIQA